MNKILKCDYNNFNFFLGGGIEIELLVTRVSLKLILNKLKSFKIYTTLVDDTFEYDKINIKQFQIRKIF